MMRMRLPRVIVADDDERVLEEVGNVLRNRYDVVACVRDGRALLEETEALQPDIVVADISMPELSGIEAAQVISAAPLDTKVVILSIHDEPVYVEAAFEAGAAGYVLKLNAVSELTMALDAVAAGGTYLSSELREDVGFDR